MEKTFVVIVDIGLSNIFEVDASSHEEARKIAIESILHDLSFLKGKNVLSDWDISNAKVAIEEKKT